MHGKQNKKQDFKKHDSNYFQSKQQKSKQENRFNKYKNYNKE